MAKKPYSVTAKHFLLALSLTVPFLTTSCNKTATTIPEYQGMTISRNTKAGVSGTKKAENSADSSSSPSSFSSSGDTSSSSSSSASGADITSLVPPDVVTDPTVKYYVAKNEVFTVEVHLNNPNDYEIQSFTLNGKKYANYMFKSGSTLSLLLLEVTAPDASGYVDYTIDAIKYIDGTEIKDVKMSGEKTIQAGIKYDKAPTATIDQIDKATTSLGFKVTVTDENKLIGANPITFYLSDEAKVIDQKSLTLGSQSLSFANLIMGKTYQYGILSSYDMVDGKDLASHWMLTDHIATSKAFSFKNVQAGKTSISFEIAQEGSVGTVTSIELFDKTTGTQAASLANLEERQFTHTLSDHAYQIQVHFSYQSNGQEVKDFDSYDVSTLALAAPTVTLDNPVPTKTSIAFALGLTDPDSITKIDKIELYKGGELVTSYNDPTKEEFANLLSDTSYTIKVTYTYDLNDGKGAQSKTITLDAKTLAKTTPSVEIQNEHVDSKIISGKVVPTDPDGVYTFKDVQLVDSSAVVVSTSSDPSYSFADLNPYTEYTIKAEYSYDLNDGKGKVEHSIDFARKTSPLFEFSSVSVLNTAAVSDGDTIVVEAAINNPNNAAYDKVTINGTEYPVSSSSRANYMRVEIKDEGQFVGGNTTLTIEQVSCSLDGHSYLIEPTSNNSATVFVNGALSVKDAQLAVIANGSYEVRDYIFPNETGCHYITLNNPTGYAIDSVKINGNTYSGSAITVIDNDHFAIPEKFTTTNTDPASNNQASCSLTEISYSNSSISKTLTCSISNYGIALTSNTITEISAPSQLLNQTDYHYCKQIADLDMSGLDWKPTDFLGLLDGNGYSIKNFHCVKTFGNEDIKYGLFQTVLGVLAHVRMQDEVIIITSAPTDGKTYNSRVGGIAGNISGKARNCESLDSNGKASLSISGAIGAGYTGGLFGLQDFGLISGCSNKTQVVGKGATGGIVGFSCNKIEDCKNSASITAGYRVGGISGHACNSEIKGCSNSGAIAGSTSVSGIVGYSEGSVSFCTNSGSVNATNGEASGIVAGTYGAIIVSRCFNSGSIVCPGITGGIIASCGSELAISDCINTGNVTTTFSSVGGIVADFRGSMTRCVNSGLVSNDEINYSRSWVAGLVGNGANDGKTSCSSSVDFEAKGSTLPPIGCVSKTGAYDNIYSYQGAVAAFVGDFTAKTLTQEQANSEDFYTKTLGFKKTIWDLTNLDVTNGHYPTLIMA